MLQLPIFDSEPNFERVRSRENDAFFFFFIKVEIILKERGRVCILITQQYAVNI